MGDRILHAWDACQLADIIRAAQGNQRVARRIEGYVVFGTARSIGDDRGNHPRRDQDVRDLFLRVRSLSGFDYFWPISELVAESETGEFVANYEPPQG